MASYSEFEPVDEKFSCRTHDNGGEPFSVDFKDGALCVTLVDNPETVIWEGKVKRFWRGFDSTEGIHGCAVLAHVPLEEQKSRYLYVGDNVTFFNAPDDDTITHFASNMGNNDVPYPIAYGKNLYHLVDFRWIKKDEIPSQMTPYMSPRRYFMNPWHSANVSGLFYGQYKNPFDEDAKYTVPAKNLDVDVVQNRLS